MSNGQLCPYVEKCIHLGTTLSTASMEQTMITSSISDLNIKTNDLLCEISFSSQPHQLDCLAQKFYCMNVYGSSLWRYIN